MSNKIFGAVWCGNCNATKSQLDALGYAYEYVDIDKDHDAATANNIRSLPTLITADGQRAIGLLKILELVKSNDNLPSN
jgi:glutaredoxin